MADKKSEFVTLPKPTAKRLPVYLRLFEKLDKAGIEKIKSSEISKLTQKNQLLLEKIFRI